MVSDEGLLSGLQMSIFSMYFHMEGGRGERGRENDSISVYPHDLITSPRSHLLTLSHWGLES